MGRRLVSPGADEDSEFVAEVVTRLALSRFSLVVHDWGGAIAWGEPAKLAELEQAWVALNREMAEPGCGPPP